MNELEVLAPETKTVKIREEVITVHPFVFDDFVKVCKLIKSAMSKLDDFKYSVVTKEDGSKHFDFDLFRLVADAGEEAKALCCIATKKDAEVIGGLDMATFIDVMGTVIEVNLDFFIKKVMPQLSGKMNSLLASQPVGD